MFGNLLGKQKMRMVVDMLLFAESLKDFSSQITSFFEQSKDFDIKTKKIIIKLIKQKKKEKFYQMSKLINFTKNC